MTHVRSVGYAVPPPTENSVSFLNCLFCDWFVFLFFFYGNVHQRFLFGKGSSFWAGTQKCEKCLSFVTCPSVRWRDFREILYWVLLLKSVEKIQVRWKSDQKKKPPADSHTHSECFGCLGTVVTDVTTDFLDSVYLSHHANKCSCYCLCYLRSHGYQCLVVAMLTRKRVCCFS